MPKIIPYNGEEITPSISSNDFAFYIAYTPTKREVTRFLTRPAQQRQPLLLREISFENIHLLNFCTYMLCVKRFIIIDVPSV